MTSSLPISRLISTQVNLTAAGASAQNTSQLLMLGTSTVIDPTERYRTYTALADIATDFGTSADEYLAAVLWFEQVPQPTSLLIGRWVNAAATGYLRGGSLPAVDQAIATWNAITTGSMKLTIDGVLYTLSALNFSAALNLNGVAAIIQAALTTATAPATLTWNSNYERFEMVTTTTGPSATVTFAQPTGSGVWTSAPRPASPPPPARTCRKVRRSKRRSTA